MKPIKFKEQNKTLIGLGIIKPLPVYTDGIVCISCWELNFIERFKALVFGKIWIRLRSGGSQPPISLMCHKKGFD